jgi:D-3-phosphoglycerate dehydrogenase
MRDGVVYLNTARAKIHDTDALVAALRSGKVAPPGSTTSRASSWRRTTR